MSIFKLKIVKKEILEETEWLFKYVGASRVEKICQYCKYKIHIGDPAYTFSKKIINKNGQKFYINKYTHTGNCFGEIKLQLKAKEDRSKF